MQNTNNETIISVIIPCYNCEKTIHNTLTSVVSNTSETIEVNVIDDGSQDNTKTIIQSFNDHRIHYYYQDNSGYCSAVNYGVSVSKGKYVLFLGSDDVLINNILNELLEEVNKNKPDIICFSAFINDIDTGINYIDQDTYFESYCIYRGSAHELEKKNQKLVRALFRRDTCKLFKRTSVLDIPHYGKYGICSDEMFSMIASYSVKSYSFIPVLGYSISIHSDSVSHNLNKRKLIDTLNCFIVFEKYLKGLNQTLLTTETKNYWRKYEKYLKLYSLKTFSPKYYYYRKHYLSFLVFVSNKSPSLKYKIITLFPKLYRLYCKFLKIVYK